RHEQSKTVNGRPRRRAEPDVQQTAVCDPGWTPALWTRVPGQEHCGAAGAHRHVSGSSKAGFPRENPASGSSAQPFRLEPGSPGCPRFTRRTRPDACPDAMGASTLQSIKNCVLTTDLTKVARNKPQRNSCQLPGQASGRTAPGKITPA